MADRGEGLLGVERVFPFDPSPRVLSTLSFFKKISERKNSRPDGLVERS